MPKRTYQPKKLRTLKRLGFRARIATKAGKRLLKRRKAKGRVNLSKSDEFRKLKKKPNHRIK